MEPKFKVGDEVFLESTNDPWVVEEVITHGDPKWEGWWDHSKKVVLELRNTSKLDVKTKRYSCYVKRPIPPAPVEPEPRQLELF